MCSQGSAELSQTYNVIIYIHCSRLNRVKGVHYPKHTESGLGATTAEITTSPKLLLNYIIKQTSNTSLEVSHDKRAVIKLIQK